MYDIAVIWAIPNDMASIRAVNAEGSAMWNSVGTNASPAACRQASTRS
ncbi:hypothetical protein [Saccharothrix obliqua]|nr:hypothetical protein [Saccharothrix obliqua]MBW4722056.1 hypothetical protein [Saccharothrix obliqua]